VAAINDCTIPVSNREMSISFFIISNPFYYKLLKQQPL